MDKAMKRIMEELTVHDVLMGIENRKNNPKKKKKTVSH